MTPGERDVYGRIPELGALAGVSLAQRRVSVRGLRDHAAERHW